MKRLWAILAILLVIESVNAEISATDAVKFVREENHYIYDEEKTEQPNIKISYQGKDYWILPVTSGESVVTFFALPVAKKELVSERTINRELFETALFIREYQNEKEKISQNAQIKWIVSTSIAKRFETLARLLNDETFQLNTIETTLKDGEVTTIIKRLKAQLVDSSELALTIDKKIKEALEVEAVLVTEPATETKEELRKKFDEVFDAIGLLENKLLNYTSEIDKLKQKISVADAEAQAKSFLISLAKPPENLNDVGSISLDAATEKEAIEKLFVKVSTQIDNMLDEFETRIERNKTYEVLYGENEELRKLDNKFVSLRAAVDALLLETKPWKEEKKLKEAEKNWQDAELYFKKGEFKFAEDSAKKAADAVRDVYRGDFKEEEVEPSIDQGMINNAITALVFILVVLIIFNNREKIIGFFNKEEKEERVVHDSWE